MAEALEGGTDLSPKLKHFHKYQKEHLQKHTLLHPWNANLRKAMESSFLGFWGRETPCFRNTLR